MARLEITLTLMFGGIIPATAIADTLYVTSADGDIEKISPNGTSSTFATGFLDAQGIAANSAGDLFVGLDSQQMIQEILPSGQGKLFANLESYHSHIGDVVIDASGNLYVSLPTVNTIAEISPAGVVSTYATGIQAMN